MMKRDARGMWVSTPPCYLYLLEEKCVQYWADSYQSEKSRDDYLRCLDVVCKKSGLKPSQLLKLSLEQARRKVMDVVHFYLKQGKSSMARQIQSATRSFFDANGVELKFRRTDRVRKTLKKIRYEKIPSKEQIYRMVDAADESRDKAILLCLFQSGVRVSCLCRWKYGLIMDQLYPEVKVPVYLKITNQMDTKLSGYGLPYYYTFLQEDAVKALRAYLDERKVKGTMLKVDDPIFVPLTKRAKKNTIDREGVRRVVKKTVRKIGLDPKSVWTHTLRKSFRKVLNASDIDEDTKEAIQGHKLPGSRANYFDYHDVDETARKYMKCNFSRTSTITDDVKKDLLLTMWREQAKMFGIDLMRIRIEKKKELSLDEELELLKVEIKKVTMPQFINNNGKPYQSKIISEKKLVPHVEDGWEIIRELSNRRFLIKKPNHALG